MEKGCRAHGCTQTSTDLPNRLLDSPSDLKVKRYIFAYVYWHDMTNIPTNRGQRAPIVADN
jgi:hypothetical protein